MNELSEEDRSAILSLLDAEIAATPPSRALSPVGCLVFVAAVILFGTLSVLTRQWGLPVLVRSLLFVINILVLVGGVALIFFGGGSGESRAKARAAEALDQLCGGPGGQPGERSFQAAVRLLANGYYSGGPWMITTINLGDAAERLERASMLAWILEIEHFLVSEQRVQPMFTLAPGRPDDEQVG